MFNIVTLVSFLALTQAMPSAETNMSWMCFNGTNATYLDIDVIKYGGCAYVYTNVEDYAIFQPDIWYLNYYEEYTFIVFNLRGSIYINTDNVNVYSWYQNWFVINEG